MEGKARERARRKEIKEREDEMKGVGRRGSRMEERERKNGEKRTGKSREEIKEVEGEMKG